MFTPYLLTIRNFRSFGNNETRIRLDFTNPTLIIGQNYDSAVDGQLDSNGSGKSTILNAINYVLYDEVISDKSINADELINNINKKNMYVSLIFSTGGDTFYKVERYRKNKEYGGTGIRIFERNGGAWDDEFTKDHDITPDSIANATKKVIEIMGMEFNVFSRIVAFSATHKPFLFLPASEQTGIIEDICGLSELTEKAEVLKARISKERKPELERLTTVNNTIHTQRATIQTQIESARKKASDWDENHTLAIVNAARDLSDLMESGIDYDEQMELLEYVQDADSKIASYESSKRELLAERRTLESNITRHDAWFARHAAELEEAVAQVANFKTIPAEEIIRDLNTLATTRGQVQVLQSQLATLNTEKVGHEKTIRDKQAELAHLRDATCPYCSQHYAASVSKAVEVETLVEMAQQKANKVQVQIDSAEFNLVDLQRTIETLSGKWTFKTEREVLEYQSRFDKLKDEVERLQSAVNPYPLDKAEAEAEMEAIDADIKKLDANIKKRQKKKEEASADLKFTKASQIAAEQARIKTLTDSIANMKAQTNPLASTVAELEAIKLEDTKDDEIAALEDTIEHEQFLVKLLTKKDSFVRKLLLQKSLPFLNTRLRYYLDRIGFLHRVAFQEDLSVKISQFGNEISFGNLSSGQKARVNLALSFSFRDMLQARHGKLKFCILDECLDVGLGNVGVQLAAKMIKSVATDEKLSMFIISHRDEIQTMFDSKLVVELRSGFSTIADPDTK